MIDLKPYCLILLMSTVIIINSYGQDTRELNIKKALEFIYNTESKEADKIISTFVNNDPVIDLLRAMNIRWSNFPLSYDSEEFEKMNNILSDCSNTKKSVDIKSEHELIFINTIAKALKAMYALETGNITWNEAREAYKAILNGEKLIINYPDFLLTTGIYNYLRDKFPERYFLSFMVDTFAALFFKKGDSKLGLEQLIKASENSFFVKYESLLYLSHLNLRYESDPIQSRIYLEILIEQFPKNHFFNVLKIETYYWEGNINGMTSIVESYQQTRHEGFYKIAELVFKGIIEEFNYKDKEKAKILYNEAIKLGGKVKNEESMVYQVLAYKGLSRLSVRALSKDYEKKIKEISPYLSLNNNPSWIK